MGSEEKGKIKQQKMVAAGKRLVWPVFGIGVIAAAVSFAGPFAVKQARLLVGAKGDIVQPFTHAWKSAQDKVDGLRQAELENYRLKIENAHLRLELESSHFECREKTAGAETRALEDRLRDSAGSKVARTLASISYKPPGNLMPSQLYTLGVSYFKAHEDEKAAVIFSFLTGLEDNKQFKTPRNNLLTAVSWYRLDNYEMARIYLDRTLKSPEDGDSLQYQAQARLWLALVAEREGKHQESQHWLKDMVGHHPNSTEAGWINTREAFRATAADE